MVVGVLRLEVILHSPQSLKQKRSLVKRILGRCREKFPVSAAEVGCHELWQRTLLGFAVVGVDEGTLHRVLERLEDHVASSGMGEVGRSEIEFLHYGQE